MAMFHMKLSKCIKVYSVIISMDLCTFHIMLLIFKKENKLAL